MLVQYREKKKALSNFFIYYYVFTGWKKALSRSHCKEEDSSR